MFKAEKIFYFIIFSQKWTELQKTA